MNITAKSILLCLALLMLPMSTAVGKEPALTDPLEPVHFQEIKIDGFWRPHFKSQAEKWIPHCIKQMEAGGQGQELLNIIHAANKLQGKKHGKFNGRPWGDAYVYNTMEAMCRALAIDSTGDAELAAARKALRAKINEWIPYIVAAQYEDGYVHSFHVVNEYPPYTNVRWHEFYVQGYFIEMGVTHYRATGGSDRRLYDAAVRCADRLCDTIGPSPKKIWIHGHPGMGYALCRLARLVSEVEGPGKGDKYFKLAKFLLDTRHTVPELSRKYNQSHRPVVEMDDAVGHAVRATYFYTAMADIAMLDGAEDYLAAVDRIWARAIDRKHYITGGVGASHMGEAFSEDFDLHNDGYCEVCAGCGMTFWSDRMHRIHRQAHCIDVQERSLYNNVLGAIELSGEKFFYQNPLCSEKGRCSWHGCPCCVGNIPRTLLMLKDRIYSADSDRETLFVNHFVASEGTIDDVAGTTLGIKQETGYPWKGDVKISLSPKKPANFTLKIRIPDRTESKLYTAKPEVDGLFSLKLNGKAVAPPLKNGYATINRTWTAGDTVELTLPMEVQRIYCDHRVAANRGRVALIRGPITYNIEDVDHDCGVRDIVLPPDAELNAVWKPNLLEGVVTIEGKAQAQTRSGPKPVKLQAIPNYARLNRGGWSQVWIVEDAKKAEDEETN